MLPSDSIFSEKPKVIVRFSKEFMAPNQVHYASDISHWKKAVLTLKDGETPEPIYTNIRQIRTTSESIRQAVEWLASNIESQFYIKEMEDRTDRVLVGFEDEEEALFFQLAFL